MSNRASVIDILEWFKRAVPNPTDKNRAVQIGVHFEEVAEMGHAIRDAVLDACLHSIAEFYKTEGGVSVNDVDHAELLDALCDQIVTAIGVAHMFGLDIAGALTEVNASNWSKFVEGQPQFDSNGKIAKGPGYFKPDLSKFLNPSN